MRNRLEIMLDHGVEDPARLIMDLRAAGWHFVSDIELTENDDPEVHDDYLDRVRYPVIPTRYYEMRAQVDDTVIHTRHGVDRVSILRYADHESFKRHIMDRLVFDFSRTLYQALTKGNDGPSTRHTAAT